MRNEFPNPQFERKDWICLNGKWEMEFDFGKSKYDSGILSKKKLDDVIEVPFCPESKLSGVHYTDFIPALWYRRTVIIPAEKLRGRTFLHFGAVDYQCKVYVNGEEAGTHKGGYTSFSFEVSSFIKEGENTIAVYAEDDNRDSLVPRGKQSEELHSHGCDYTRTTGIWQSVWLEFTPKEYIKSFRIIPDAANGCVSICASLCGKGKFEATALWNGISVGTVSKNADSFISCEIRLEEKHLWEVGKGGLYVLKLAFGDDEVISYFGLRDVALDGYKFLINGKSVFQRLVLDQGFYSDGIYTAPSEEALINDINISVAAGFNGARLHQKVFEPRFLYHCDRLGYIVWGEYPNWGLDYSDSAALESVLTEWVDELERDFNHPAIVGWCPFNETWNYAGRKQRDDLLRRVYLVTKAFDKTRPCIDTSGNYHVETDIYDVHDYEQNPVTFKNHYDKFVTDGELFDQVREREGRQKYAGQPSFVSEYGGIGWTVNDNRKAWGYGNNPRTEEEFFTRYKGLTDALLDNEKMFGFCYTQLYDIEQEQNGLYTYDRKPKFDCEKFRAINSRKAAIEE